MRKREKNFKVGFLKNRGEGGGGGVVVWGGGGGGGGAPPPPPPLPFSGHVPCVTHSLRRAARSVQAPRKALTNRMLVSL